MSGRYTDLPVQDLEAWADDGLEDAEDATFHGEKLADAPAHVCQCAHLWEHHYHAQRGCSACPCATYQDTPTP